MARNALTQWLHEHAPDRFVVWDTREWLMVPSKQGSARGPFLAMDLRESNSAPDLGMLDRGTPGFRAADSLAARAKIPFLVVEFQRGHAGEDAPLATYVRRSSGGAVVDKHQNETGKSFRLKYFPGGGGSAKAINRQAANAFHEWQRDSMPRDIVFQDIDVLVLGAGGEPSGLLEHKQSFQSPKAWNESDWMRKDAPNYGALLSMGNHLGLSTYAVYQDRTKPVSESTEVGVFRITGVTGTKVARTASYVKAIDLVSLPWSY